MRQHVKPYRPTTISDFYRPRVVPLRQTRWETARYWVSLTLMGLAGAVGILLFLGMLYFGLTLGAEWLRSLLRW